MKRILFATILLLSNVLASFAGNWERKYMPDEFGDPDYSKPVYVIDCVHPGDDRISIEITYINGAFVLDPCYYGDFVSEATTLKAKGPDGIIYNFEFEKPSRNSSLHLIKKNSDVMNLIKLLEQGNFTLSFHRPSDNFQDSYNYNFKIGHQGQGIRSLAGLKTAPNGKATFKGKIGGKYSITMVFDQPESVFENGGQLTGVYWYGTGKNGKMKLKGSVDQLGRIELVEYDPSGKKCGEWYINTLSSDDGMKYALYGVMTNAKGDTYNVDLTQQ